MIAWLATNTLSLLLLPGRALDAQIIVIYVPLILVPVEDASDAG